MTLAALLTLLDLADRLAPLARPAATLAAVLLCLAGGYLVGRSHA
jgi:hypothetical protein